MLDNKKEIRKSKKKKLHIPRDSWDCLYSYRPNLIGTTCFLISWKSGWITKKKKKKKILHDLNNVFNLKMHMNSYLPIWCKLKACSWSLCTLIGNSVSPSTYVSTRFSCLFSLKWKNFFKNCVWLRWVFIAMCGLLIVLLSLVAEPRP